MSIDSNKTEIIIVRHGESLANATRVLIGQTDLDLTERGREQAAATAEFLRDVHIDAIYSSDLCRAYNTARPHAELRGLEIITDRGLRETHTGRWENTPYEVLEKTEGEHFEYWRTNFGEMLFPGGESTYGSGIRFYETVLRIAQANLGRRILIATHAGVIRAFWGILHGLTPVEMNTAHPYPTNASCSYVTYDGERLIPEKYSVNSHLESIGFIKTARQ